MEGAWFADQSACGLHLSPDIPEQHAAHTSITKTIDHTFLKRSLPIRIRFQTRQILSIGLSFQRAFVRGGRSYGMSASALMIPMLPDASASRIPCTAAS